MNNNSHDNQGAFSQTLSSVRKELSLFKSDLLKFKELKKTGKDSKSEIFKSLARENMERLLFLKSGQRELAEMVELTKKVSENERRQVDIHNLTLQSMLYEKDYFVKEIHFCKEFKTPQLQQALRPEVFDKFKNLQPNITEKQNQDNIKYLADQLKERKELSEKLKEVQVEKSEKEMEFQRKQKLVDEFPQILRTLEDATLPLQEFLNVKLTEDNQNMIQCSQLPLPLNSLFRKLYHFSKQYPMFCMDVHIKGDFDQVEQFYERYESQLLYNPKYQIKVNRNKVQNLLDNYANSNQGIPIKEEEYKDKSSMNNKHKSKADTTTEELINTNTIDNGVSDNSKKIKKDKKKKKRSFSKTKSVPKAAQNLIEGGTGALEEGEEDINNDINMLNLDIQFDPDEKPQSLLLDQFEKFPLHLEVRVEQNPYFFDFKQAFSKANTHSIEILREQTKNEIGLHLFPLCLRIFLVPELNVLTIEFRNKTFNTDQVLGSLSFNDSGKQIKISELSAINSQSNERIYEWLHNWGGLYLDISKNSTLSTHERPQYVIGDQEAQLQDSSQTLSTKLIISKIWQRLVSKSILNLQIDHFQLNKHFLKEVIQEFLSVKEFQILLPKSEISSFKKTSASDTYEVVIQRDSTYKFSAVISIPQNYPDSPPIFKLKVVDKTMQTDFLQNLHQDLMDKMDQNDLRAVENLRPMDQAYNKSGEPMQPILDSIEDELHLYYESYCKKDTQQDFLLSFQIRKLMSCLEILQETSNVIDQGSGQLGLTALFKKAVKGRFKKRPFSYNENLNLFEQR